MTKNEGIEQSD